MSFSGCQISVTGLTTNGVLAHFAWVSSGNLLNIYFESKFQIFLLFKSSNSLASPEWQPWQFAYPKKMPARIESPRCSLNSPLIGPFWTAREIYQQVVPNFAAAAIFKYSQICLALANLPEGGNFHQNPFSTGRPVRVTLPKKTPSRSRS